MNAKVKTKLKPQQKQQPKRKLLPILASMAAATLLAVSLSQFTAGVGDNVSANQALAVASAFADAQPVHLEPVPKQEHEQAIADMKLSPEEELALKSDVVVGAVALKKLIMVDWLDEDGDIVKITSGGSFSQTVAISHTPITLVIPVTNNRIELQGIQDPGGGVTVACFTASGKNLPVPPLYAGATVEVFIQ